MKIKILVISFSAAAILLMLSSFLTINKNMVPVTIYDFEVMDIQGKHFSFSTLKGKKILIVNTASECGLTPQYKGLQALYEKYKNKNFIIVGFPANNFGAQEPGSNAQISQFCQKNYGVTFPMMEKISVKGADMHPIYKFLTEKKLNRLKDSEVSWNFQKYAIGTNGNLEMVFEPSVQPDANEIKEWIEKN
ncbi:MAG: glutathione peroxidase [Flavobacterium sp. BFFFF2]|nr:MAG: glutathione peroxidase [Flavobacterium sp. BFFFF2]